VANNSRAINRVFTRGIISELLEHGSSEVFDYVVRRFIRDTENKTHGELFSEIYAHLGNEYRNEYYYTNTLLNKLLVGIHNVNTTTALAQLHIGRHIADFVMINGEGHVYEIKSSLDNFDRLSEQLKDYFRAFSKVSVLASIDELEKVDRLLSALGDMGAAVGIYVLSERDTIFSRKHGREPKQFDNCLDHVCIFKLLRKREYENIVMGKFGEVPKVQPVYHFRACLEKFAQIPILEAQELAFLELKKRNKITKAAFGSIQHELKSAVYFSPLVNNLSAIGQMLQTEYGV
jgi:hypothetical protein